MSIDSFPPKHLLVIKDWNIKMFTDKELAELKAIADSLVYTVFLDNDRIRALEEKAISLSLPKFRWPIDGNIYLRGDKTFGPEDFIIFAVDDAENTAVPLSQASVIVRRKHVHNLECIEKLLEFVEKILTT